jgi:DNA-binding CsgD family transcriptional regulator
MERAEDILSAVQRLYDGLLTPAGIVDALPSLCAATRSTMSMCTITKTATGAVPPILSVGYDPEGIRRFRDFIADYGLPNWVSSIPVGTLRHRTRLIADDDFARSAYYNEVIKPIKGFYAILAPFTCGPTQQALVSVGRSLGSDDFDGEDLATMGVLVPHFITALKLRQRLGPAELAGANTLAILDRLAMGIIVVDALMRPIFVNARAGSIVVGGALTLTRSAVTAALTDETQSLHGAITAALELAAHARPSGDVRRVKSKTRLRLSRPSSDLPLIVTVIPMRASDRAAWAGAGPHAVLFLTEPEQAGDIDAELLAANFELTPREASFAVLLLRGVALAEAAATLGIGIGTARWYLKRVLEKTGTHRQSELILLLSGFADRSL